MSDFDEEAEREKLREKYERDQEQREATERMSDLLLKGATMTNAHCGTCGDPVFRHEGQEFCPTCQEVLRENGAAADEAEGARGDAEDETGAPTETDAQAPDAADASPGTGESVAETDAPAARGQRAPDAPGQRAATAVEPTDRGSSSPQRTADRTGAGTDQSVRRTSDARTPPETGVSGGDELGEARAALTATLTELARSARQTDDLERRRAHLAAVEDAADALAALNRADR